MLNFADRTGYGAFMVLWPQMVTSVVGTVIRGSVRGERLCAPCKCWRAAGARAVGKGQDEERARAREGGREYGK